MNKLQRKIKDASYGKIFKWWLILGLCAALLGGGLSAVLLKPQISEAVAAVRLMEEEDQPETRREEEKQGHLKRHNLEALNISEPSTAAKVTVGITGVLALLFGAFYWLLVAAWLYSAAEHARMHGLLWGLLGLGGNLFAAVLFAVVRSLLRSRCPSCGTWQKHTAYCSDCGAGMERICPKCGAKNELNDCFCPVCGQKLGQ